MSITVFVNRVSVLRIRFNIRTQEPCVGEIQFIELQQNNMLIGIKVVTYHTIVKLVHTYYLFLYFAYLIQNSRSDIPTYSRL